MVKEFIYRLILGVLLLTLNWNCEKRNKLYLEESSNNYVVVKALITNENKIHEVVLTKPIKKLNAIPKMITGAKITITSDDKAYSFKEDSLNPGVYKSMKEFIGVIGHEYFLTIDIEELSFRAKTYMVPVTPNTKLKYHEIKKDTSSLALYQLDEDDAEFENESYMREIYLDWSDVPGYEYKPTNETRALVYSYSFNSIGVNQIFRPDKKVVIFPKGTKVRARKFSLTNEHAQYLRAVLSETDWKGGYFDEFSSTPPTNFNEGALGFFGASSVAVNSVIIP